MDQLTPQEAEAALLSVQAVGRRSRARYSYGFDGPHLMLWGAAIAVGQGLQALAPQWQGRYWLWVDIVTIALGALLLHRQCDDRRLVQRYLGSFALLLLFLAGTRMLMRPLDSSHFPVFVSSLIAFGYALSGVWFGGRYLAVGVVMAGTSWLALVWPPGPTRAAWQGVAGPTTMLLLGWWQCRSR